MESLVVNKDKLEPLMSAVSAPEIRTSFTIHDRNQAEIKVSYPINSQYIGKNSVQFYDVDLFLFFPRAAGLTPTTYPKERFYQDLRPLLRLREPQLNYQELTGHNEDIFRSPMLFLNSFFHKKKAGQITAPQEIACEEACVVASSFASYLTKEILKCRQSVFLATHKTTLNERNEEVRKAIESCTVLVKRAVKALHELRSLVRKSQEFSDEILLTRELQIADEYSTYAFRDFLSAIFELLHTSKDFLTPQIFQKLMRDSLPIIRYEKWYARKKNFYWIDETSEQSEHEFFVIKRSNLKKHIQKVFYLNLRTKPIFTFQQQLASIMAAGFAGMWAIAADLFIRFKLMKVSDFTFLSLSGFLILTAFIMAYILKDRIKDLGRSYFSGTLFSRVPDHSNDIHYHTNIGKKVSIGNIQEYTKFSFIDEIPEIVQECRKKFTEDLSFSDSSDPIIHYRKKMRINSKHLRSAHHPIEAINDIIRINFDFFLPKLGEPLHREYSLTLEGHSQEILMPRVYFFDIALFYSGKDQDEIATSLIKYARMVLTKDGLSRVEEFENS